MAAAELQASRMVVNLLGGTMETTSICGLGQVASNALRSYLRYFASDVSRDLDATR
jgi:NADH:ubiquinone oxidoreductase subunit F (NADH-binding)